MSYLIECIIKLQDGIFRVWFINTSTVFQLFHFGKGPTVAISLYAFLILFHFSSTCTHACTRAHTDMLDHWPYPHSTALPGPACLRVRPPFALLRPIPASSHLLPIFMEPSNGQTWPEQGVAYLARSSASLCWHNCLHWHSTSCTTLHILHIISMCKADVPYSPGQTQARCVGPGGSWDCFPS